MIRFRVRATPVATALALVALEAGVDPSTIFEMTIFDFAKAIAAAKRRRLS